MMKLWFESYAKGPTLTPSAALSIVAHVVLIGAAVAATADSAVDDEASPESTIVSFLAPPDRAAGQRPQAEMIRYVSIAVPAIGPVVSLQNAEVEPRALAHVASGTDPRDAPPLPALHGEDSVFSVLDVDSIATRYEWSAAPAYPPKMLETNTEGLVRATFIVGQDGYADTASLKVLESTHPDFTRAVRDALPFMRFRPAKMGAVAVSQMVLQEFRFEITQAAKDSVAARKPIP